ncbi:MAG: hypothetical protein V3T21_04565, partial [Candidatus Margulisiibacteriota bacterium]
MRKVALFMCLCVFVVLVFSSAAFAFGEPAPEKKPAAAPEGVYVIDDFESGSIRSPREWWTFDIQTAKTVSNQALTAGDKEVAAEVGNYSLQLKGDAANWYVGGCGTYIAKEKQDLSGYNSIQLDIYGNGPGSGTLKIELFDDDNRNWQVEQDSAKAYAPIYDDKLVYDIRVDWKGWRRELIPFDDFVDDNPRVGDDVWNPQQEGGSGGFLQIQFICIAAKSDGS